MQCNGTFVLPVTQADAFIDCGAFRFVTAIPCQNRSYSLIPLQLAPQIWTNWRTKTTDGLPGTMMFLWALCGVPFGAYAVVQNFNVPLQIQPQCFMGFCLVSWVQTLIYHRSETQPLKATRLLTSRQQVVSMESIPDRHCDSCIVRWNRGGFDPHVESESGSHTVCLNRSKQSTDLQQPIYERGNEVPAMVVGIVAAILLAAGLLPPYGEIWKRRGRVVGINWV